MPFNDQYQKQVALLVHVLPFVAEEKVFALKGGTAINLFIRDMPRLSVDIDLTYLPIKPRPESLADIDAAMTRISDRIKEGVAGARVAPSRADGTITKLVVRADNTQIKIEVTPVLRGCVYEPETRTVSESVEEAYGFAEMPVVSFADLYGGKIVAALDRQHPRDLFDVRDLLANEGISPELRNAFLVYLLSHDRPMSEVLEPTRKDISDEFLRNFEGMTDEPVKREELVAAREALIKTIVGDMPDAHRHFLVGFEKGEPDWSLIDVAGVADLPAVKWRQQNLDRVAPAKRQQLVQRLEEVLFGGESKKATR